MFKINLLYPQDNQGNTRKYGLAHDMEKDLNLPVLFDTMAKGNDDIYSSCRQVIMTPITNSRDLHYRQEMVMDTLAHPAFYEGIYQIATDAVTQIERADARKRESSKTQQIYESLTLLKILTKYLNQLKTHLQDKQSEKTDAMWNFVKDFRAYYSQDFANDLEKTIENLSFLMKGGLLVMTAGITGGLKCGDATVNAMIPLDYRQMGKCRKGLRNMVLKFLSPEAIMLNEIALKQEAAQMEANGLHHVLTMYQGFIHEFQDLFLHLRNQIGFYIGCNNLHRALHNLGMETTFPILARHEQAIDLRNLYELSMALTTMKNPVPNTLCDSCRLHIISGANQGGKSTFLRSIGIAQVMMQAGMFVPASYYESPLYDNILTHFTRREDCTMNSGRLVEEMKRMDRIISLITSESLILLNESFATTTETEGSQIAENIIQALYDCGVHIYSVTHLFAFAKKMYSKSLDHARFFSAERLTDGTRTFKMIDHEPTETSYGMDLYHEMIG